MEIELSVKSVMRVVNGDWVKCEECDESGERRVS